MAGRRQPTRRRARRGRSRVGEQFLVDAGPVAHGGSCVARIPEESGPGRVVFVRHALPGERVLVSITEGTDGDRFWRGDAVAIHSSSPDRVPAPCPVSGPGGCGGCDLQHVALPAQREWKATVVAEQLSRLAGLSLPVTVEPVAGDVDGLRWRTRTRFARTPDGRLGMRKHRRPSTRRAEAAVHHHSWASRLSRHSGCASGYVHRGVLPTACARLVACSAQRALRSGDSGQSKIPVDGHVVSLPADS